MLEDWAAYVSIVAFWAPVWNLAGSSSMVYFWYAVRSCQKRIMHASTATRRN